VTQLALHSGPLAVLAGSGRFPALLAESLRAAGHACRILALRGFADGPLRSRADAVLDVLDVQGVMAQLRAWQPGAVILAGGVARPKPSAVFNAFAMLRNQQEIRDILIRGDDHLLRGVVRIIEEHGHRVIGVHEIAPDLLAPSGVLGAHAPNEEDLRAIEIGKRLLVDISPYDIGQGVVVAGERVIAIEGPEGTDKMLGRVEGFSAIRRFLRKPSEGVLVKLPKNGQDLRVDLPAIGPRTFANAAKAGLRGVAIGTGATLVLDREETIRTADRLGLFLLSIPPVLPGGPPLER
jgi:hypothetical protein